MPNHPVQVEAFDHVTLIVKDLDRSHQFYVETLGMADVSRPDFNFAGSWFQIGPTQIHLIQEHPQSGPAGGPEIATEQKTRSHHLAFRVADANAVYETLKQTGIAIVSAPKPRPDGATQVFVQDPDGHLVELCSPPTTA